MTFLEKSSPRKVYNTGNDNPLAEFAGFISFMDVVVTSDTLGMHLAIAAKKEDRGAFRPDLSAGDRPLRPRHEALQERPLLPLLQADLPRREVHEGDPAGPGPR